MKLVWWLIGLYLLLVIAGKIAESAVYSPVFWYRFNKLCKLVALKIGYAGMFAELRYRELIEV